MEGRDNPLHASDPIFRLRGDKPVAALLALASAMIVLGGLHLAAPLATQVLIIAFATIIISPVYDWLVARKVPPKAAVALTIVGMAGVCVYVVGFVLPRGIWEFSRKVAVYHRELVDAAGNFANWLRDHDVDVPKGLVENAVSFDSATISATVRALAGLAGRLTMNVVLDVIVVAFLLAELPVLPKIAKSLPFVTESRWAVLSGFARDVRHYMTIKTAVSALTGICVWGGLKLLSVDSPELLGFTAFLFNFVPGIGSVVAAVPGILLALNGGGASTAAWTAVLYVAANQILGNIIEPRIMGRGFGVSPAVVLLSVLFWGWVLGPVGMFFAVPLSLAVRGTLVPAASKKGAPGRVPAAGA